MQLKTLLRDDDAVSPVIGVILMVAITVILAAVIGTFVLGLGQNVSQTAPTVSMSMEPGGAAGEVDITLNSGGPLTVTNLDVLDNSGAVGFTGWSGEWEAGETITITGVTTGEQTVKIRHNPSDSIIASSTVQVP